MRNSLLLPPGGSTALHSPIGYGPRSSQIGGEDFEFNGEMVVSLVRRA